MLTVSNNFKTAINAPTRRISARVELYTGSTLNAAYTQKDALKSITIDRVGEDSKFFGFVLTHKYNIRLRDVSREINVSTANHFIISLGVEDELISFPLAYVTEVNRDENTNELSITAYDLFNVSKTLYVSDLDITAPYTIKSFINACSGLLDASGVVIPNLDIFNLEYETGANFEGSETIYEALTAAAEATQTICYLDYSNQLVFKRLDNTGAAVLNIDKSTYITLDSSTNRRLQTIASVTELGDNVSASTSQIGTTQYMRDNPFLELREDIADLLNAAIEQVGDITINQFNCQWRGNPSLELGDKIALTTKDGATVISYLLNDSISYDGGLSESSEWNYEESGETESNPSTIGETLKQTYARVDKANKQVEIVASEISANSDAISALQLNTESISASVKSVEENTSELIESLNTDISTLAKEVETKITAEDVNIAIKSELDNGVSKVKTETGFTFDENGLTISKTGQEMTTNVNEDGISVFRDDEEVLTADNKGVIAYDLHAKTYLIVGESSRFEDYEKDGEQRTGCFWIGGAN
jgi:cob(I)alamin adenosyltransferase